MKILCVGGGSGGHITPIVAVIERLRSPKYIDKLQRMGIDDTEVRVWCDRKFAPQARQLLKSTRTRVDIISAGKFRRYANLKWWYRWFSPWHIVHTHIPNLIDAFKIMGGFIQSLVKLRVWRPDVVFCKGGYVSLPVGLVAHLYHIPLIIHDSDTVPGLTNRVLAKYANAIGTGAPVKNYPSYPRERTKYVGIPVSANVQHISRTAQMELKRELGLDTNRPLILAMGGGLGAVAINNAARANAIKLIKAGAEVVLFVGKGRTTELLPDGNIGVKVGTTTIKELERHFHVYEFSTRITDYEQAADIVITRAGATTMAELAAIGVATIIIPSPYLAGDHQTKNAKVYEEADAAVVLNEFDLKEKPSLLYSAVDGLLSDKPKRNRLADNLHDFARPHALDDMVDMIISTY